MFGSKKCKNCQKDLKNDWVACPYCGQRVDEKVTVYRRPFNVFFDADDIDKEFERIDKMFSTDVFKIPKIDIGSPFKGGGISITIRSGNGMKPKVEVRTNGQYKKVEPNLKRKLGVTEGPEEEISKFERKIPKSTEEPEMKTEKKGNMETIYIKLPDVKSNNDIEIRRFEQSLEIKAFAGDKAYFKLIPVRPNTQISDRSFSNGVLKIEIM